MSEGFSYLDLVIEQRDEAKEERDVALDRIAELERAAETTRVEHAAALAAMTDERDRAQRLANAWSDRSQSDEQARDVAIKRAEEAERLLAHHDATAPVDAEHAAALGLATARIRELEGKRDELLKLVCASRAEMQELCASASREKPDCTMESPCWWHRRRAIVARIEKAGGR